jgi:hypothetical protein
MLTGKIGFIRRRVIQIFLCNIYIENIMIKEAEIMILYKNVLNNWNTYVFMMVQL